MRKIKIKISVLMNYMLFVILIVLFGMLRTMSFEFDTVVRIATYTSTVILVFNLGLFYSMGIKYWDFRAIYIILNMIFLMGHIWLCFFHREDLLFWPLLLRANSKDVLTGVSLALCGHQAIVCGMFGGKQKADELFLRTKVKHYNADLIYRAGVITLLICGPLKLYYDLTYIITAHASSGYLTSADIKMNGMVATLANIAVVGFMYILSSKKMKKRHAFCLLSCLVAYFAFFMSVTGDRRMSVIIIICFTLCYLLTYNVKVRAKNVLLLCLSGYVGLIFLNIIMSTRREGGVGGTVELLQLIGESFFSFDILGKTFAEFGLTLMEYIYVPMYFPSRFPYRLGSQILYNVVTILPIGFLFKKWRVSTGVQTAVNSFVNKPVGGSIVTDLFGNFGWFSIGASCIFGYILYRILDARKVECSSYECAKYFSFFYVMLNCIRAGFGEVIRLAVMTYLIPKMVILLFAFAAKQKESEFGEIKDSVDILKRRNEEL